MTWTAAADAVVPTCADAYPPIASIVTGFTAIAVTGPGCRRPVRRATRGSAGLPVPPHGCDAISAAARGLGCRPGRHSGARPPRRREARCVRPSHRSHPLRAHLATPGWPSDPGRDAP